MNDKYLIINKEHKFINSILKFDENKINYLATNENALELLNKNISKFNYLTWEFLCSNKNPKIFSLISKNLNKLSLTCWSNLCYNKNDEIVSLILDNINLLNTPNNWLRLCFNENKRIIKFISNELKTSFNIGYLENLCKNKNAIDVVSFYKAKFNKRCIKNLCINENAYELLKEFINFNSFTSINTDYINNLCLNRNKDIVKYLFENFNNLNRNLFINICLNPAAISLINHYFNYYDNQIAIEIYDEYNTDTMCLCYLCYNENPDIIPIIIKNLHYFTSFNDLCINKNAIDIIDNNINRVSKQGWLNLSKNVNGFKIIKKNINIIKNKKLMENNSNFINYLLSNSSIFKIKTLNIV
jgi:hypothetical protein